MTTMIRGVKGARTGLVALEDLTDDQLAKLKHEFDRMHQSFADEGDEGGEGGAPPKQPRRQSQQERPAQRAT